MSAVATRRRREAYSNQIHRFFRRKLSLVTSAGNAKKTDLFPASFQDAQGSGTVLPGTVCRANFRCRFATISPLPITNVEAAIIECHTDGIIPHPFLPDSEAAIPPKEKMARRCPRVKEWPGFGFSSKNPKHIRRFLRKMLLQLRLIGSAWRLQRCRDKMKVAGKKFFEPQPKAWWNF